MKTKKYYLATGALACSAILGLVSVSQSTYANNTPDPDANHAAAMQIVSDYEDVLQTYFDDNYPDLSVSFDKHEADYGPFYKPDSINAYVRLLWSYSLDTQYAPTSTDLPDDPNDTMIANFLTEKGFQKYAEGVGGYPPVTEYLNSETGIICSYISGFSLTGITCSHTGESQISTEWATFLNSIGTAYYTNQNKLPTIMYSPEIYTATSVDVTIEDSDYSPYQHMSVPINNFVGLFYRQSPTSDWVYFTGTQAALECSEFTGEAQKGFAGYVCYNGNEESKVTVATTPVENGESSGTKAPNTGLFTTNNQGLVVITSATALSITGIVAYISRHIINRQKSKIHFGKK